MAVSRQAGKVLKAAQDMEVIHQQRDALRQELKSMYRETRKRQRKVAALKKKAAKVDLTDLMQMLMMKAYIHNVKHSRAVESQSGASSSDSPWVPRDGVEALDRLRMLAASCTDPEVIAFAESMRIAHTGESRQDGEVACTETHHSDSNIRQDVRDAS